MIGVAALGQQYNANANLATAINGSQIAPIINQILGAVNANANLDGSNVYGITADASAKFGGLSLFASFTWMHYKLEGRALGNSYSSSSVNPWGFVVQGGYSFTDQWEVFGRFGWANANTSDVDLTINGATGGIPTPEAKLSLLTVGVNYFINSNVKFTADWGINFNNDLFLFDDEQRTGWTDSASSDQWVLRAQLQLHCTHLRF